MASQHQIVLFDGTREMLAALKARNHWLAVATGKSRLGLNEALDAAQLRPLFDSTRTADETASKPHPLMLQELMAELGAEAQRTLMIGDTTHDLQLAVNAGVACVGVSYGAHPSEDFHRFAPLFVAHSTRELHDWLHEHA
jgi:phosphoglycolate phosphatase